MAGVCGKNVTDLPYGCGAGESAAPILLAAAGCAAEGAVEGIGAVRGLGGTPPLGILRGATLLICSTALYSYFKET